jgi:hypothetical protein
MTTTSFVCAMEGRTGSGDRSRCQEQCAHCGGTGSSAGERNPQFERAFLDGARYRAGADHVGDFSERVSDRLLRSERQYGRDSYRKLSFGRILNEIEEEALDLGGWSVLAALLAEVTLDDETVPEAQLILQEIAAHGARADGLLSELRRLVDEAR